MVDRDGQVVLIFNGEIYNFRELRTELEAAGVRFLGGSDTEVLLQLYLAEGHNAAALLKRLNGIFAFALWDARKQTLLVARDALGVKPLYFFEQHGRFGFASEIKALLQLLPETPTMLDLDADALQRYLTYLWCPGEGTPLKAVRKLAPGEALLVRSGRVAQRLSWYCLPAFRDTSPLVSERDAISGTLSNLRTAVHRQMVADVPVGAFLSGGLDSSAVVALARERDPDIRCFSIESRGGEDAGFVDDLPFARCVAAHLRVPFEVVSVTSSRMAAALEDSVAQLDEPLADPASINVFFIAQLARQHGIKVLLSGAGGDDIFSGYRRHQALMADVAWKWLSPPLRSAFTRLAFRLPKARPVFRRLSKYVASASLRGDSRLTALFRWIDPGELNSLYTPAFRASVSDMPADAPLINFLAPLSGSVSSLARMLALEQRFFLGDHNLIYTDKMAMAAGVEVRVPFLDLELIDFAARIPDHLKQRNTTGKWVLKRAMEPYLPKEVISRSKTGFGAPLRRWMRYELRELVGDYLSVESLKRRGLFDAATVQRLIATNNAGRVDASYTLLSLLCIEIWCRRYLDGRSKK
jgi:asparagine synthase (glutamine-hydrolysing)